VLSLIFSVPYLGRSRDGLTGIVVGCRLHIQGNGFRFPAEEKHFHRLVYGQTASERGSVPPLHYTFSWRGDQFSTATRLLDIPHDSHLNILLTIIRNATRVLEHATPKEVQM
jgi:hypothetical protein